MIQANTNKHKEEAATIRPNQSSRGDQIMKSEDHLAAETVRQKREPRRWTSSWPCWQRLWWPRRRCWMRCLPSWTPAGCRARWHRCRRPAERSRAQGCWLGSAAPSVMDLQTAPLKHQCQPPARSPPLPWSPRAGYEPQGGRVEAEHELVARLAITPEHGEHRGRLRHGEDARPKEHRRAKGAPGANMTRHPRHSGRPVSA